MAIILTNSKPEFQPAPIGTHRARCIQIIQMGNQHDEYKGKPRIIPQIRIGFELVDEIKEAYGDEPAAPWIVYKTYTENLGEQSNLRKDLFSWRGQDFTEEELQGFNLDNILTKPCLITVQHATSGAGRTYAKISNISPPMKGMDVPPHHHDAFVYEIRMGRGYTWERIPEWIQEIVAQSEEFKSAPASNQVAITDTGLETPPF